MTKTLCTKKHSLFQARKQHVSSAHQSCEQCKYKGQGRKKIWIRI